MGAAFLFLACPLWLPAIATALYVFSGRGALLSGWGGHFWETVAAQLPVNACMASVKIRGDFSAAQAHAHK